MSVKYLDQNGLLYFWQLLKAKLNKKVDAETGKGLSSNDYTTTEKNKLASIASGAEVNVQSDWNVTDTSADGYIKNKPTIPAAYSLPIASATALGGVKVGNGLSITDGVLSASGGGEADSVAWENVTGKPAIPTNNNQLINGAGFQTESQVTAAISAAVSTVYKPSGSITFATLPTPAAGILGNVYNVTDAFITTASFLEGAGKSYPAGTNVVIVLVSGSTYKFDTLAGAVDLTNYVQSADIIVITNAEIDAITAA